MVLPCNLYTALIHPLTGISERLKARPNDHYTAPKQMGSTHMKGKIATEPVVFLGKLCVNRILRSEQYI